MARLSQALGTVPSNPSDRASAELTQLLARLEQSILRADHDRERRLRTSEVERARINKNLEYARKLLTRLEQEAMGIKLQSRRMDLQTDLNKKRELTERLVDHMNDLSQLHEDEDDSSEGEDILSEIIPTPSESMVSSRSTDVYTEDTGDADEPETPAVAPQNTTPPAEPLPSAPTAAPAPSDPGSRPAEPFDASSPGSTLRQRGGPARDDQDTAVSTARAALFASRRSNTTTTMASNKTAATTQSSTATAEAILDHQRAEQDALSDSILKMATALKTSSQRFSSTLEDDKLLLDRAGEGMNRTERGMDAASRRMGALKRMTEGKGWWGRMILYAWVYGLMVALVLLVFVLPKLRF
ncbi:synaptobrevin [Plectosphaerella cucumerina]|uniref:Synaptobrevin n=1 Tax=Plectosphaerella cucumerina TaxID=40658 RepID=A0A8K0T7T1_9PEZI|nr:synaptobrevin [Plectosphaerella cucumerina]